MRSFREDIRRMSVLNWIKKYFFGVDTKSMLEIAVANGMIIGKNVDVIGRKYFKSRTITIGSNVIIGANGFIAKDIPENSVVVGILQGE